MAVYGKYTTDTAKLIPIRVYASFDNTTKTVFYLIDQRFCFKILITDFISFVTIGNDFSQGISGLEY